MEKQPDFGELEITKIERETPEYRSYKLQWTVSNYSLVKPDKLFIMHKVLIGTETCYFKLYKKQKDYGDEQPRPELILSLLPSPSLTCVRFGIIGANNREIVPDPLYFALYILSNERQAHFVETPDFIVDDSLTISATIMVSLRGRGLSIFKSIEKSGSMTLGNLLQSGMFADIEIVVGEETFQAHKAILCARSTVMEAMFENDLEGNIGKRFRIEAADAECVGEMLNYIYTGETKELNLDLASNLFQLADTYDLQGLKFKVASFLKQVMSISNALRTLVLADRHNHGDLKEYATEFIGKNLSLAMRHRDWKSFRELHTDLFENVLECVAEYSVLSPLYRLGVLSDTETITNHAFENSSQDI